MNVNHANYERFLRANIELNKQAALNSPQHATWSLGVSAGYQAALEGFIAIIASHEASNANFTGPPSGHAHAQEPDGSGAKFC